MMIGLWRRLPVVVRAVVVGLLVNEIGQLGAFFIVANLKALPRVPWLLAGTGTWLWLFWRYANGDGWPASTRAARREDVRAPRLPGRIWAGALLAGAFGLTSMVGLAFLTQRLAGTSREAFKSPLDIASSPWWMIVSILAAISATAGVAEEVAFRGYMLTPIQRRHGWAVAGLVTGTAFFLSHYFSHAYATFAFLPFFLAISTVHTLLVALTGSIRPSIVLHAVFDFLVIPLQYGMLGSLAFSSVWKTGPDTSFFVAAAVFVGFGLAAVPAFRRLARISGERASV